jgi:hypothetical protein
MHILQDLRIAARQFRKTPGFAVATIATLALGIGAATAIFSLVDGVMLRPLPFPQPGRLLWLQQVDTSAGLTVKGEPVGEPGAALGIATPGYFETLRIPILAGRAFTARDGASAPPVVIVNEAFARKFFPGENPIGKRLTPGLGDGVVKHPVREIIGVAGSVKRQQLTGDLEPQYYLPYAQAVITSPTLLIRTVGDPTRLTAVLRDQLA